MQNKFVLTAFLALSLSLIAFSPVIAASPTPLPSATPEASPETSPSPTPDLTQTTQRLRERIEKIVEEKRDQIEGALDDLASQRRGFIGEVQRVSSETLTLKTNRGTQILPIGSTTDITKAGKTIPIDDIAVGDWAIVIGSLKDDTLVLNRLLISSTSLRPKSQEIALGNITALTKTTITVQPRSGEPAVQFNLTRTTEYQDVEGNPIRLTDVETETQALAVGVNGEKGVDALVIRILVPLTDGADD